MDNHVPKNSSSKSTKEAQNSLFETDHLKVDLKNRSVKGGAVTISSQILKFVLQTGTTFLLARFLTPEDFGLIGMVTVLLVFAEFFKDLGLSTATIQKANINQSQVNTLFWINVAISSLTVVIVALLAPAIAWFYKEPRLVWITVAFSMMFFFSGLTVQHRALLKRQMQFTSLAKIEIISMVVGTVSAIASASMGASYWSIVIWRFVQTLTGLVAIWTICLWRPGFPSWDPSTKSMLAFGSNVTGFNLVNYFSRNLDNILIGRYWGPQELGLYSVAYRILLMPIQQINAPITTVALPALSRLQTEPKKYENYYYKSLSLITVISMPVVGFSFASADILIPLMLGTQWVDSVIIFRLLAPAAFFGTFNVATGWVFTSLGSVNKQLYQGVITSAINIITFIICIRWGAIGIAAGFGISRFFIRIPSIMHCYKDTSLSFRNLLNVLLPSSTASIVSALAIIIINFYLLQDMEPFITLLVDLFFYIAMYFGILSVTSNGRNILLSLYQAITIFLTKAS